MVDNIKSVFWVALLVLMPWLIGTILASLWQLALVTPEEWDQMSRTLAGAYSMILGGAGAFVIWDNRINK